MVHNLIEHLMPTDGKFNIKPWKGSDAQLFCDSSPSNLLLYHHTAINSQGAFYSWTKPAITILESTSTVLHDHAVGFNNYNNYLPLVCFIL